MTRSTVALLSSIRKKTTSTSKKHPPSTDWNDLNKGGKTKVTDEEFGRNISEKCGVSLSQVVTLTEVNINPIEFLSRPALIKRFIGLRQIDFSGVSLIQPSMYIIKDSDHPYDPNDHILAKLHLLPNLRSLRLSYCSLTTARFLAALPRLEYCDLSHNCIFDLSDLAFDLQKNGRSLNLQHIDLSYNTLPHPSSLTLEKLGPYLPCLRRLDLKNCPVLKYSAEIVRKAAQEYLYDLDTFCGITIDRTTHCQEELFTFSPNTDSHRASTAEDYRKQPESQTDFSEQVANLTRQSDSPSTATSGPSKTPDFSEIPDYQELAYVPRPLGIDEIIRKPESHRPSGLVTYSSQKKNPLEGSGQDTGISVPKSQELIRDSIGLVRNSNNEPTRVKTSLARWRDESLNNRSSDVGRSSGTKIANTQPLQVLHPRKSYSQESETHRNCQIQDLDKSQGVPNGSRQHELDDQKPSVPEEGPSGKLASRREMPDTLSNLALETPRTPVLHEIGKEHTGPLVDSHFGQPYRDHRSPVNAMDSPHFVESAPKQLSPGTLTNLKLPDMHAATWVQPRRTLRDQPDAAMLQLEAVKASEAPVSLIGVKLVDNNSIILAEQSLAEDPAFKRRQAGIRKLNESRRTLQPTESVGQTHPWTQDNIVFPGYGSSDEILSVNEICQYWNKLSSILVWAVDSRKLLENEVQDLKRQCDNLKARLSDLLSKFLKMRYAYLASLRRLGSADERLEVCGTLAQLVTERGEFILTKLSEILGKDVNESEILNSLISGKCVDALPCFLGSLAFANFGNDDHDCALNFLREALFRLGIPSDEFDELKRAESLTLVALRHITIEVSSLAEPLTWDQLRDLVLRIHESHNTGVSVLLELFVDLCGLTNALEDSSGLLDTVQRRVAEVASFLINLVSVCPSCVPSNLPACLREN